MRRTAGVAELVRALMEEWPIVELAASVGAERTTVARWMNGTTEPKLPELLRIIETTTQRLLDFVALFVDPESLPSTRDAYRDLRAQRRLAYELPWSHGVLRALELEQYRKLPRHEPGFVAARLGLSLDEERRYLSELAKADKSGCGAGAGSSGACSPSTPGPAKPTIVASNCISPRLQSNACATAARPPARCSRSTCSRSTRPRWRRSAVSTSSTTNGSEQLISACTSPDQVVLMNLQLVPLERSLAG